MRTKPELDTNSPDTDVCIDAKPSAANRLNDTAKMVAAALVINSTDYYGQTRFFEGDPGGTDDAFDEFVADITTIVQSQCERATDYADIETLVSRLPIDHLTFAAHDSSAPYSGPYPMALLVRAFIVEEINGWDETALHDYLRANPSLRRGLGFGSLLDQSTFWRAWNHRFNEDLRDAVQKCAEAIVKTARACEDRPRLRRLFPRTSHHRRNGRTTARRASATPAPRGEDRRGVAADQTVRNRCVRA